MAAAADLAAATDEGRLGAAESPPSSPTSSPTSPQEQGYHLGGARAKPQTEEDRQYTRQAAQDARDEQVETLDDTQPYPQHEEQAAVISVEPGEN